MSYINNPEVRKRAYDDVNVLATTIRRARAGFVKVRDDLVTFDSGNHKDTNGKHIQLGIEWQLYIEVFIYLILSSKWPQPVVCAEI